MYFDAQQPVSTSDSSGKRSSGAGSSGSNSADAAALASRRALGALPNSEMYERSFMHRDHVTHVIVTASDFVVTGSRDGQVKFWKKMQKGIEFVKHFRAHLAPIACMSDTADGTLLATTAADKAYKVPIRQRVLWRAPLQSACAPPP